MERYGRTGGCCSNQALASDIKVWGVIAKLAGGHREYIIKKEKPQYSFCGFRLQHYFIIAI